MRHLKSADEVQIKPRMKFFLVLVPGAAELKSGVHRATVKSVCPGNGMVTLNLPGKAIRVKYRRGQRPHPAWTIRLARVRATSLYRTEEAAREAIDEIFLNSLAMAEEQLALVRRKYTQQRRRVTSLI